MKTSTTYTNEFTGEVFSNKDDCEKSEARSKTSFITNLVANMDLIKDICNSRNYCEDCPFNCGGVCKVGPLADNYLNIVCRLQSTNN